MVQLNTAGQHLQSRFCFRKVLSSSPWRMLPAEKLQQESLRGAQRCACAQFSVLNAMSPLGSVLPHLLGMLSCLLVGKKTKMMRGSSSVVNALAQLLILLSEIHSRQVLVLGKLLFPRPRARKLFKCFYDKW